jgi:hypothetical protein
MSEAGMVYQRAILSLQSCSLEGVGLLASGRGAGHRQVWTLDAMITLLGAALVNDPKICSAIHDTLRVLKANQAPNGAIPNNVDPFTGKANFRAYADSGLWWAIGSLLTTPDPETIRRIFAWCECQDVDQTDLLSMHESADWQDLFCTRGKALTINCLYVLSLRLAAKHLPEGEILNAKADRAAEALNAILWYNGDGDLVRSITHTFSTDNLSADSLGRKRWIPTKRHLRGDRYYLPYVAFRIPGEWFDMLGNLLAILSGVAGADRTAAILDLIERYSLADRPARSLYPVIQPGDSDWRDYYASLNTPHCYHNGGIWPFIGAFYVAALVYARQHRKAEAALKRLAALNAEGEFNEWHYGETGAPMGVRDQAWSAGTFIWAYECVRRGRVVWIED